MKNRLVLFVVLLLAFGMMGCENAKNENDNHIQSVYDELSNKEIEGVANEINGMDKGYTEERTEEEQLPKTKEEIISQMKQYPRSSKWDQIEQFSGAIQVDDMVFLPGLSFMEVMDIINDSAEYENYSLDYDSSKIMMYKEYVPVTLYKNDIEWIVFEFVQYYGDYISIEDSVLNGIRLSDESRVFSGAMGMMPKDSESMSEIDINKYIKKVFENNLEHAFFITDPGTGIFYRYEISSYDSMPIDLPVLEDRAYKVTCTIDYTLGLDPETKCFKYFISHWGQMNFSVLEEHCVKDFDLLSDEQKEDIIVAAKKEITGDHHFDRGTQLDFTGFSQWLPGTDNAFHVPGLLMTFNYTLPDGKQGLALANFVYLYARNEESGVIYDKIYTRLYSSGEKFEAFLRENGL